MMIVLRWNWLQPVKEIEPVNPKKQFIQHFEELFEEDYMPKNWDEGKKRKVAELTSPSRTKKALFASIPIVCRGPACPYAEVCPLLKADVAPVGFSCPIEAKLVANTMAAYIEQFDIEDDNFIELSMVREMVDIEVQYMRQDKILSMEHFIQENVVGVDSDGDPVMRKELHIAVELADKLHKRRQALFKNFLATRESRLKAGLAAIDPATLTAGLLHSYREQMQRQEEEIKAKLGIVDQDEYIEGESWEASE